MGSRSGSDSGGGGNDMEVSGMEAAVSTEKGIGTHSDKRVSNTSFSRSNNEIVGRNEIDYVDNQGNLQTTTIGTGAGQVDPGLAQARLGYTEPVKTPNLRNVSYVDESGQTQTKLVQGDYSDAEIEKGYTDYGEKLNNVNGRYMTKDQMYSTGIIAKDPVTGEDVMGNYTVDPETGELVSNKDKSFWDHLRGSPVKYSPTGSLIYATGANIGEAINRGNFGGFNEAGKQSMVNNYFTNLNNSVMTDVQKAYDQAKANINSTLTPTSQQFGYSDPFPGGYTTTNLTNNPFNINYLKLRGLI
jgi:hypothetical protein